MSFYLRKDVENDNFWIYKYEIEQFFPNKREWERIELDWEKKIFRRFHIKKKEGQTAVKTKTHEGYFATLSFIISEKRPDEINHLMVYMAIDFNKLLKPLCEEWDFGVTKESYVKIRKKISPFLEQFPDIKIHIDIQENIGSEDRKFLRYNLGHHILIYEQSYEKSVRSFILMGTAFISFVSLIFILSSQDIQFVSLFLWLISVILVNGFLWKTQFQDKENVWEINTENKTFSIKTKEHQLLAPPITTEVITPLAQIYFRIKKEEEMDSEGLFLQYRADLYLIMEAENSERIELLAGNFYDTYRIRAEEKIQQYINLIAPNIELY